MTHDVIRHLLDDYVTGDLSEDARAPVADHIATCAACSAEVESLKRVLARASQLPKSADAPTESHPARTGQIPNTSRIRAHHLWKPRSDREPLCLPIDSPRPSPSRPARGGHLYGARAMEARFGPR